jgi:hypothetical protein
MLIYHQHHDTYHCIFRMLSIISILGERNIEFAKLRIIDFYFVFPHLVDEISFPRMQGTKQIKAMSKSFPKPFESLPNKKRLFSEMGDFQIQAIRILSSKNILLEDKSGIVSKGNYFSNDCISDLLYNNIYIEEKFFSNLVNICFEIPLLGNSGLKMRTGLMEFRYDAV